MTYQTERYVRRPIAHDVIQFTGTLESAVQIAEWIASDYPEEVQIKVVDEEESWTGEPAHNVILSRKLGGVVWVPILVWGFYTESDGVKPLTIETLEGEMTAAPGHYIVKGAIGEYHAVHPDAFAKTYRKQVKSPRGGDDA